MKIQFNYSSNQTREFLRSGCFIMGESLDMRSYKPTLVQTRRFMSHFGVSPTQCSQLWILLKVPENGRFKHLLWALLKLKVYATEEVLSGMAGCDEKTFRKWSDQFITALALLSTRLIKWNSRTKSGIHTFSVDGTDCPINEPSPFSPKWYSHKFRSAGLRYEIAVSLFDSEMIWINGPFPCGEFPDSKIFRRNLAGQLSKGEKGIADQGYRSISQLTIKNRGHQKGKLILIGKALARHENVNQRIKRFGCLRQQFRHELKRHVYYFRAVASVVQLRLKTDNPINSLPK